MIRALICYMPLYVDYFLKLWMIMGQECPLRSRKAHNSYAHHVGQAPAPFRVEE